MCNDTAYIRVLHIPCERALNFGQAPVSTRAMTTRRHPVTPLPATTRHVFCEVIRFTRGYHKRTADIPSTIFWCRGGLRLVDINAGL